MASSLLKTLRWFPIALEVQSKGLSMTIALHNLAPAYLLASACDLVHPGAPGTPAFSVPQAHQAFFCLRTSHYPGAPCLGWFPPGWLYG